MKNSTDSFNEILKSNCEFIESVGLEMSEEDKIFLICTELHKVPFKHRFIAGSTKDLSCLLTKVLTTIKDGLIRYCDTKTSSKGVNSMWIVKSSTSLQLLSSLDQLDVRTATSVQTCIRLFNFVHISPTQSAEVSNYYTCTQLIQKEI